jgi:hypothetical protein
MQRCIRDDVVGQLMQHNETLTIGHGKVIGTLERGT